LSWRKVQVFLYVWESLFIICCLYYDRHCRKATGGGATISDMRKAVNDTNLVCGHFSKKCGHFLSINYTFPYNHQHINIYIKIIAFMGRNKIFVDIWIPEFWFADILQLLSSLLEGRKWRIPGLGNITHTKGCHCCPSWKFWECMRCICMYNLGFGYSCWWWSVLPYKTLIVKDTPWIHKGGFNRTFDLLPQPSLTLSWKCWVTQYFGQLGPNSILWRLFNIVDMLRIQM
jgi:hypothetical protein